MKKHDDKTQDHPGVRFPPPLFFILGFAVSLLVHKFLPLYLIADSLAGVFSIIGRLCTLIGLAFMIWGLLTFLRFRTAVSPYRPASHVVTTGPYRFSRNTDVCWFYHSLHWWHFNKKHTLGSVAASRATLASGSACYPT